VLQASKFGVLIDDRFVIDAEGAVGAFDDLKSAVTAVDPARLRSLK
jgi:hypothetical protein